MAHKRCGTGATSGAVRRDRSSLVRGLGVIVGGVVALAALGAPSAAAQRGYELVSPVDKEHVDLNYQGPTAVSPGGDHLYFTAPGAFAGAPTNTLGNNYLSRRGSNGWSTRSIDVPAPVRLFTNEVVYAFSPDLSTALFSVSDPPVLVPGEPTGNFDLYMRDTQSDEISLVTSSPPLTPDPTPSAPGVAWASPDLKHILFDASGPTTYFPGDPVDPGTPWPYYVNRETGEVGFVPLIPDDTTPEPDDEISVPADGSFSVGAGAGIGTAQGNMSWGKHSVSDNGSRIFFSVTRRPGGGNRPGTAAQLYVRKDFGTPQARTVRVSAPEAGVVDPTGLDWEAWFRAASADGRRVLFTSCQRLTADSTADATLGSTAALSCGDREGPTKSDLYLFHVDANGGAGDLVDLTTADPAGADVIGFLGASDDGSRAYFVARGNLAPGATGTGPKIYLWEEDTGLAFVAELSPEDDLIWDQDIDLPGQGLSGLEEPSAEVYVTPDGGHLAFSSVAPLEPGFDNGGHSQVYLYAADSGSLACASCTGPEPSDADATLQNQVFNTRAPKSERIVQRHLSDDGRRLFFETAAQLVGRDVNGEIDAYEYDAAAGTVSLLASGDGGFESHFLNTSPTGDDAFFTTRQRLVGWDTDNLVDIYDARVGGGFPEPEPPRPDCGLDCQGTPAGLPSLASPQSSSLVGPGDPASKPRASFRVRRLSRAAVARLARGRTVRLHVRVNRAGRVTVRIVARVAGRRRTVGRAGIRARRAGSVRLALKLSRAARRELARKGALRVTLSVRLAGIREPSRLAVRLRRQQRAGSSSGGAGRGATDPTNNGRGR